MNEISQEEQTWIKDALKQIEENKAKKGEWLKFEENVVTAIQIVYDPLKTFEQEEDHFGNPQIRIPVIHDGIEKTWGLNPYNPIYEQLLKGLLNKEEYVKIMRIGTGKDTRLSIVRG